MDDLPKVSCILPTCGRCPHLQYLVEEAIYSFLLQGYPNKELIILNDCEVQTLVCSIPEVKIHNESRRYASLGDKYNRLLELADGGLICPFEDDDISLPWRLSLSVRVLGNNDYFNPKSYFFLNASNVHFHLQFEQNTGYAHNASIFRKATALAVGGYPSNCKQDAAMDSKLRRTNYKSGPLSREECFYIYRWGVGPHLSGNYDPEKAWEEYGKQKFQRGRFELQPHWRQDYAALVNSLEKQPCQ